MGPINKKKGAETREDIRQKEQAFDTGKATDTLF
jgi:hypothetical protein